MRNLLTEVAFSHQRRHLAADIPLLHRALLLPVLSFASSVYNISINARKILYRWGVFEKKRLPVPVISVGNLTWGGNGKTPMVEFLSFFFSEMGVSPLVLTRGYAGGDEAKMLARHLSHTNAKIGVGANRAATGACLLQRHGYVDSHRTPQASENDKIGVAILDDGMQHWDLSRDLDIVMINGLMPWGNKRLIPRGPLREELTALERVDIAVIHHADLITDGQIEEIESTIWKIKKSLPIYFSRLTPMHFFEPKSVNSTLPLSILQNLVVLCVSAIGFPSGFIRVIEMMEPLYVESLNFGDHHFIQTSDIEMIKEKIEKLQLENRTTKAITVVTEKDYDRDPIILKELNGFCEVLVLCSTLEIVPLRGGTDNDFKHVVKGLLFKS